MKIGILTQTLHNNYGGLLQNYALQQVLIRSGHEPKTIDHARNHRISSLRLMFRKFKVFVRYVLHPDKFKKPAYVPNGEEESLISSHTQVFINKYINCTKTLETHKEFLDLAASREFHAYVVGSDQCWRPQYNRSFLNEMFLSFAEQQTGVKRVAYAASFGKNDFDLPPAKSAECARLAKMFDLITVREDCGVDICKRYFGLEAKQVMDPTLLLSKNDYINLIEEEHEPQSSGNLFYYILDPAEGKTRLVRDVASQLGLKPFTVMPKYPRGYRTKADVKKHLEDCVYPSVTSWLRAFMDAEMTIVDSFHGMAFSIVFNKNFWVIGNKNRGMSRFTSLLKMFGLEERLIDIDQFGKIDLQQPINWECVNRLRDQYAEYSISLLYGVLNSWKNE